MDDFMEDPSPREELEQSILATMLRQQDRLRGVIELIDPKQFEEPMHQTIAQALVEIYRLRGCIEKHEFQRRLGEQEAHLAGWLMVHGDVLPPDADLPALLGSEEVCGSPGKLSVPLDRYRAQECQWLWPGRVPLAQLTVLGGEAGCGKSLVACDLIARATSGRTWPDGVGNSPVSALVVASPEEVESTIRPRLDSARAAIGRVHIFPLAAEGAPPAGGKECGDLLEKLAVLERAITEINDCRLVVIDPFQLSGGRATAAGRDGPARLRSLARLARRRNVAVVALVTLAARREGEASLLAAAGQAAAVWQVARHSHRQELRLLLPVKNARGPDRTGLSFNVEAVLGDERLQWQDKVGDGGRGDRISDAARWLRQALGDGPMKAGELLSLGEENGYTSRMLHHAKFAAGVAVFREGFGRGAAWNWILLSAHESEPLKNA
ncbi:MAG TPA: AAA family ATPase [Pirellulales bacterium]